MHSKAFGLFSQTFLSSQSGLDFSSFHQTDGGNLKVAQDHLFVSENMYQCMRAEGAKTTKRTRGAVSSEFESFILHHRGSGFVGKLFALSVKPYSAL